MNDIITLITDGSRHEVFCALRSVGHTEFYEAYAADLRPELKFIIADYLDYNEEPYVKHGDKLYRVIRTYRSGQELEITVVKASLEEVAQYG